MTKLGFRRRKEFLKIEVLCDTHLQNTHFLPIYGIFQIFPETHPSLFLVNKRLAQPATDSIPTLSDATDGAI